MRRNEVSLSHETRVSRNWATMDQAPVSLLHTRPSHEIRSKSHLRKILSDVPDQARESMVTH